MLSTRARILISLRAWPLRNWKKPRAGQVRETWVGVGRVRKGFPLLSSLQVPTLFPGASGEPRGGVQGVFVYPCSYPSGSWGPWVCSLSNREPESHLQSSNPSLGKPPPDPFSEQPPWEGTPASWGHLPSPPPGESPGSAALTFPWELSTQRG